MGVCNINGCPQLIGAQATNGKDGFVLTTQFDTFQGTGYIPVYESDAQPSSAGSPSASLRTNGSSSPEPMNQTKPIRRLLERVCSGLTVRERSRNE
jgi:hypothetical protein